MAKKEQGFFEEIEDAFHGVVTGSIFDGVETTETKKEVKADAREIGSDDYKRGRESAIEDVKRAFNITEKNGKAAGKQDKKQKPKPIEPVDSDDNSDDSGDKEE